MLNPWKIIWNNILITSCETSENCLDIQSFSYSLTWVRNTKEINKTQMTNRDVSTEKKASGVFYIFDRSMENRINPREDFWWSMELNGQKWNRDRQK